MGHADVGSCSIQPFGKLPGGADVNVYTLKNSTGMVVTLINYGATIVSIKVPDKNGVIEDVALGFDTIEGYLQEGNPYFGCTIGRVGNRTAKGTFVLGSRTYSLAINDGVNHLHGGLKGFDKVLWTAQPAADGSAQVLFSYDSHDGEEGYPGNMHITVTITLTNKNIIALAYHATTDADTFVNLTNHTYFNLNGSGTITEHELQMSADAFLPIDATQIPTGEIRSVAKTPFDFRNSHTIGERIAIAHDEQLENGCGYDHNFILGSQGDLRYFAKVFSAASGRLLEVATTEPGVQLYSGNFLNGSLRGKQGIVYQKRTGFCLETQHYPDAPNQPSFPSILLKPGEVFTSTTHYRFSVAHGIN